MSFSSAFKYPEQDLRIHAYTGSLGALFPRPEGRLYDWPPIQVTYLESYLTGLHCASILEENHYLDRDYIEDLALFYSRSLRDYPNHCRRLHFFSRKILAEDWQTLVTRARRNYDQTCQELSKDYRGFSVVRPLPGRPIGRTVLATFGPDAQDAKREFQPLRTYTIHLGGLTLRIEGLAFQQQDQGVSACATTALWTALNGTGNREALKVPTPAEITLAASRYLLMHGRTLPSEGLAIQQICEAVRDAGLAPVLLPASSLSVDRGALDTFLRSGFPAVLAVMPTAMPVGAEPGAAGHAVCAVGSKIGAVDPQPDERRTYRDGSSALKAVYVHDDRLGPYVVAHLFPLTVPGRSLAQTALRIKWPGTDVEEEQVRLHGIVVPVPNKIRLSVIRVRVMAHTIAQALGDALPDLARTTTVRSRYCKAPDYQRELFSTRLSPQGLERLTTRTAFSRYIAVVELSALNAPLADILLDCTEAVEHPSVIALVNRSELPKAAATVLTDLAAALGAPLIE